MEVEKMIHDNTSGFGRMNGLVADKTGWFLLQDIYFFPTGAFKAIFFFLHNTSQQTRKFSKKIYMTAFSFQKFYGRDKFQVRPTESVELRRPILRFLVYQNSALFSTFLLPPSTLTTWTTWTTLAT